jgi:hypothetical protein
MGEGFEEGQVPGQSTGFDTATLDRANNGT